MSTSALLGLSTDAVAASWDAGDWKVSMGGNINAFYVHTMCDDGDLGAGGGTLVGLACSGCVDENGDTTDYGSVQNGLLPASLNFSAATNQEGWDISGNVNVYTDRLAQINYSTPNWGGFQGTLGIFQGFDGNGANSADTPGYHGKVSYTWDGALKGMVSATYLNQAVITDAGTNENIQGMDVFAKVSIADFSLLGYYFTAEGMSSLAIGGLVFPGFDAATGAPEEVNGYMAQATYAIGKVRFGINWAQNEQEKVTEVENKKLTFGVYYNLTPALTILAEYSDQESELIGTGTDASSNYTLGAILFF
jgi:hypothetical protein